jgi:hypothetical protein
MTARDCDFATKGLNGDLKLLRRQVRALWTDGYHTQDMARMLNLPECECERALHQAMQMRRAVVQSLCGND